MPHFTIDSFKAKLQGGGARANQYKVFINPPRAGFLSQTIKALGFDTEDTSFLVTAASLPGQTLGEITVPFRGRNIYLAGDRTFDDAWTTTFLNDTDFKIRNAMEKWSNGINDLKTGKGVSNPSEYQADLRVEQLHRDDTIIKYYIFRNAWPQAISTVDLSSDTADAIETFEVTWRYQHFEASEVTGDQHSRGRTG